MANATETIVHQEAIIHEAIAGEIPPVEYVIRTLIEFATITELRKALVFPKKDILLAATTTVNCPTNNYSLRFPNGL
jgi:hypothetical protein